MALPIDDDITSIASWLAEINDTQEIHTALLKEHTRLLKALRDDVAQIKGMVTELMQRC